VTATGAPGQDGGGGAAPATTADLLPTASGRETWRAAGRLLRPHRAVTAAALTTLVLSTVVGLTVPPLLGRIVDVVLADGGASGGDIDRLAALLLAAVAAQAVLGGLATALVAVAGERALADLRETVVGRALDLRLADVERTPSGDLLARVTGDVEAVSRSFREALPELVGAVLTVGLTLVGLALLDWRLALAGLVVAPIHVLATRWYLRRSGPVYASERVALGARTSQVSETLGGAATVRAFRLQDDHGDRVDRASSRAIDRSLLAARIRSRFFAWLNGAELVGLGTVLAVGFVAVRADVVTVGEATAAALYFHRLFNPFNAMLGLLDTAQDAGAALARLVGVASVVPPAEPAAPESPLDASVVLRGVGHEYVSGHPVLRDVDLRVAPGERVAVVGPTGAGKTTLAKLVAGIHDPTAGRVLLGGRSPAELGGARTRAVVALVTQEVHVFSGTVADDLRLVRPDACDADLVAALDRVGARAWVEALPHGLATTVGEGGHVLGPAQAQQLALARLVLADRPVVVLDEATAEAGSAGARVLEASAARAVEGRTVLVVAHRLTQAAAADRVVVLEAGRVVEDGMHDELVAAGGAYARLWSAWRRGRT
jgi:ATP-binding cassette subfamily C protein